MQLNEVDRLLDPAPMRLETGFERLANGVLHIACRTDMHGCTGEMLEWWFRFRPNTQQYIWWHPVDHVSSTWIGGVADTHVGSIHKVEEYFSGLPMAQLLIQFRDPTEFFDASAYAGLAGRDGSARPSVGVPVVRGTRSWMSRVACLDRGCFTLPGTLNGAVHCAATFILEMTCHWQAAARKRWRRRCLRSRARLCYSTATTSSHFSRDSCPRFSSLKTGKRARFAYLGNLRGRRRLALDLDQLSVSLGYFDGMMGSRRWESYFPPVQTLCRP